MVAVSKILRSAAKPINTKEFFHAFANVWSHTARSRRSDSLNVGLAISGGVDSMALAALCSQLNHVNLESFAETEQFGFGKLQRFAFQAFIVDHGARVGSDEEAFLVSKNLEQISIPAKILKLQWPDGCKPMELSNFESIARALRYQALGKACFTHGIEPLLTAHHEDDQVETVVMRLLRGARGVNLQGMRSSSDIPECHGIYGVNRSGGPSYHFKEHYEPGEGNVDSPGQSITPLPIPMESGGVHLYRPLLNFTKSRLIATCVLLNTSWFEDKTNQNPTLTQRNAIRHLYQKDLMPKALSKPAILNLARKMEMKHSAEDILVESMFAKIHIKEINWNAGTLKVRFPKIFGAQDNEKAWKEQTSRIARLLRSLIYFVTPNENVVLSDLGTACEAIFPEMFSKLAVGLRQVSGRRQTTSFTTAGVQFTKMASAMSLPGQVLQEKGAEGRIALDREFVWVLSRQAYKRSEKLPALSISPRLDSATPAARPWSPWYLYDGRFWIRVSNTTSLPIVLRPFLEKDMAEFGAGLKYIYSADMDGKPRGVKEITKEQFARLMKDKFPGAIRYTLPAIVTTREGRETVLALPTVGVAAIRERELDWEVRYKYVDDADSLVRTNQVCSSKSSKLRHRKRKQATKNSSKIIDTH